jgi:Domain of unknown function (DUF4956)
MRRILDNVILRLLAYYMAILAVFAAITSAFPWVAEAIIRERARSIVGAPLAASGDAGAIAQSVPMTDAEALVPIVLTLIGALALALPVAFVYQWTREPEPYRRDFGRALVALPIAVALAVFLVKNSLALAFSLAGIVAAIRWRAALRETMDGVFMFVMIGIGLAAGVQLLMVAFVASVVFNAMILTLARTGYAARPRQLEGWTLTAPVPPSAVSPPPEVVAIRIETSDQGKASAHLETILALCAKEWQKAALKPLPDGHVVLEYRATLRKRSTPEAVRSAISSPGIPEIRAVALTIDG